MGIGNIIVLCQVIAFLVSFILSFFVFIPMSINYGEFSGNCLLGASGTWTTNGTVIPLLTDISWGASSDCGFIVFIGVVAMLLSILYVIVESVYLFKDTDSSWLASFITCIACLIVCLMLFAAALIIDSGFKNFCNFLIKPPSEIHKCDDAAYISFIKDNNIYSNNFYTEFSMVQFGAWTLWICWVFLSVIAIYKVYRYHKREAFLTSMNRERQRLLQKVGHKGPTVM